MQPMSKARILRVYCGQSASRAGKPLYEWIVGEAIQRGLAGATAYRGVLGFGGNRQLRTAKILRLSEDLPVIVEIVDTPEWIEEFLPIVQAALHEGLLVLEEAKAMFHIPPRIRDIMHREVITVAPDTPFATVVNLLLQRGVKAVPVMDGKRLVGIITGGDLLTRGRMPLRLDIQRLLPPQHLGACTRQTVPEGLLARDVMSAPVTTLHVAMRIKDALGRMTANNCKRLPVLDDTDELVGIVSRVDVLRAIGNVASKAETLPELAPGFRKNARDVMFSEVPTVAREMSLSEVLPLLVSCPLRRVVVVDAKGRVAGIITDRDLVKRYARQNKPGLLHALLASLSGEREQTGQPFVGTAHNVMRTDMPTVGPDTGLATVVNLFVEKRVKRLLVVDREYHYLGMVDRNAVLRGVAEQDRHDNDYDNAS
ncbi:MAG: DUF190 domain-containing protein [Solidesulfovibrio sp.]